MMRQAALQCLRSTKKSSKPKPFWLANVNTNTNTICVSKLKLGKLCPQLHHSHPFSSLRELTLTRSNPRLVGPTEPTPREIKQLSDIDDQPVMRMLVPFVHMYRHDPSMEGRDPAGVIRDALARALVLYYPLAGRLREGPDGRLSVDCTGEGVLFVEAEADVELAQLGDPPRPPFPWYEELLCGIPCSGGIVNSPIFFIQVTRLRCGGFTLGFRYNHIMSDGGGLAQFLSAVAEIARGARAPSVTPVWRRELFINSQSQRSEKADQPISLANPIIPSHHQDTIIERSFIFGQFELLGMVPAHVRGRSTTFEVLTAYLWRCHAAALQVDDPDGTATLVCAISARHDTRSVVPAGYYGNAVLPGAIEASVRKLRESPIEYAIGLVRKAKEEGGKACASWRAGRGPATRGDPPRSFKQCFMVTDTRRIGLGDVDFGWGKAAYAGMAKVEAQHVAFYVPFRNHDGENGILVSISLPAKVMERFEAQVKNISLQEFCKRGSILTINPVK